MRIGVTESTYQSWEVGRYEPKGWRRRRLAEVFGVEVEDLGFGK